MADAICTLCVVKVAGKQSKARKRWTLASAPDSGAGPAPTPPARLGTQDQCCKGGSPGLAGMALRTCSSIQAWVSHTMRTCTAPCHAATCQPPAEAKVGASSCSGPVQHKVKGGADWLRLRLRLRHRRQPWRVAQMANREATPMRHAGSPQASHACHNATCQASNMSPLKSKTALARRRRAGASLAPEGKRQCEGCRSSEALTGA